MEGLPAQLLDAVKDNIVVQWFLVIVFILLVGTNTATKLKGPIGSFARWVRAVGENRDEREAQERRRARERIISDAREGREFMESELREVQAKVESLLNDRTALEALVEAHLGWDYDRRKQLIDLGVKPADIPAAPPLRVTVKAMPIMEPSPGS